MMTPESCPKCETTGMPPGEHRPRPPAEDRMKSMMGDMYTPRPGAPRGPGQSNSYDVPVHKWKGPHKR